jgi:hypothetical protein
LTFPWLVDNDTWKSEISIFSHRRNDRDVQFEAHTAEGETRTTTLEIQGYEIKTMAVADLFPGLTRFSLSIRPETDNFTASLKTTNITTPSGNSAARVSATTPNETSEEVLFGYWAGDQVPALVLTAPWAEKMVPVTLTLLGESGPVAETQIQLNAAHPTAAQIPDLFPEVTLPAHMAVLARSSTGDFLTGTSFTFNRNGEPAMAKAIPINR